MTAEEYLKSLKKLDTVINQDMKSEGMQTQGKEFVILSKEELTAMQQDAAQIGARVALEKMEEEKKKFHSKAVDWRLHNTKLLLQNYRMLRLNHKHSIYCKSQMKESAVDILNNIMGLHNDEMVIDSIKRSTARTAIIISHVEKMLELYKLYCESSKKKWEQRRYDIIYDFYISDESQSIGQISEKYHYSKQTIYDDINAAESTLSALIFGIDGIKII